ncbi:MAG: YabP/YqfC family sporulation protein [Flavonifractor plautii]
MEQAESGRACWKKTAEVFDLPGDVVAGLPRIELTGSRELRMENHKGILSYGGEEIHISGGKLVVKVRGSGLELPEHERQ